MDCSPPGSTLHGDSPGKNTGVGCHALLQGISQPRDQTQVSHIAGRVFTVWATRELPLIKVVFLKWRFPETCAYYENTHTKSDHVAKLFLEIWKRYLNVFVSFFPPSPLSSPSLCSVLLSFLLSLSPSFLRVNACHLLDFSFNEYISCRFYELDIMSTTGHSEVNKMQSWLSKDQTFLRGDFVKDL